MARAAEQLLNGRISAGCVNVKDGDTAKTGLVELRPCGHPVPDERGFDGARRIAEICTEAGENDLVICLLSGGASALTPYPAPPITLGEKQETTRLLLACGANIHEMNAVRKHLSAIKGGQLARLAAPAHVLSLILSDVVGDDLDVIGSRPHRARRLYISDCLRRSRKVRTARQGARARSRTAEEWCARDAEGRRSAVRERGEHYRRQQSEIARKPWPRARRKNWVIGRSYWRVRSAANEGRGAHAHAAIARQIRTFEQPVRPPVCVISGGETTVTMRHGNAGKGGRNQEFALGGRDRGRGTLKTFSSSAPRATDGTDGPYRRRRCHG